MINNFQYKLLPAKATQSSADVAVSGGGPNKIVSQSNGDIWLMFLPSQIKWHLKSAPWVIISHTNTHIYIYTRVDTGILGRGVRRMREESAIVFIVIACCISHLALCRIPLDFWPYFKQVGGCWRTLLSPSQAWSGDPPRGEKLASPQKCLRFLIWCQFRPELADQIWPV